MSRPKFLADNDLRDEIIKGVRQREPLIEFPRMRERGLAEYDDADALEWAADRGYVIVSHDVTPCRQRRRFAYSPPIEWRG